MELKRQIFVQNKASHEIFHCLSEVKYKMKYKYKYKMKKLFEVLNISTFKCT